MKLTETGNIKIAVNTERKYQGQFVGHEYYRKSALDLIFGPTDWATINPCGYDDLGISNRNDDMIRHHCSPFRRIGIFVE